MRLVQVTIPSDAHEDVVEVLEAEGFTYFLTDEVSDDPTATVGYISVPTEAVEGLIQKLRDAGIDKEEHVVIIDAETDLSEDYKEVEERYPIKGEYETRIAREELHAKAKGQSPDMRLFLALNAISALIAASGLLVDSTPIIVGAMVIAPLLDPPITTSVGTMLDDPKLFRRGLLLHATGLGAGVVSAFAFGLVFATFGHLPSGVELLSLPVVGTLPVGLLLLLVALAAGSAGVLSLTTEVSTPLIGVAITATLVPAAASMGIGAAMGDLRAVGVSAAILLLNVLAINLAANLTLWVVGFRPRSGAELLSLSPTPALRNVLLALGLAAILAILNL